MPDVVCRCGTYVRAYVESGTKINCPQCGVVLTMGPSLDIEDSLDERAFANTEPDSGTRNKSLFTLISLFFIASIGVISIFALGRNGFQIWAQNQEAQGQESPILPLQEDQVLQTFTAKNPEPSSLWSATGAWQTPFSKIPSGSEVQALCEQVSSLGAIMDPSAFWDWIDLSDPSNPSNETNPLVEYLKTLPIDLLSSTTSTACSDWRVLGFHQKNGEIGVLVRYFYEPLSMNTANSGEWILACRQILSQEEMLRATEEVFQPISELTNPKAFESPTADLQSTPKHLLLTPRFGYLVLVLRDQSSQVVCTDLVGIPGDVPLSQTARKTANVGPGQELNNQPAEIIDVFGQYQSSTDRSLAGSVLFRNREDQTYTIAEIRRFIQSISEPRAKRLAEIAEAATIDPSQLGPRMTRFRKEFPNDLGADSLLISIWFTVDKAKRPTSSYDDVGKVYVESAHRLYMKTSDPLLLEIKSRIYRVHGRMNDADKSLLDAEKENHQSIYLIQHRIQEAIDAGNKRDLVNYLTKLNELPKSQSTKTINPAIRAKWSQLLGN